MISIAWNTRRPFNPYPIKNCKHPARGLEKNCMLDRKLVGCVVAVFMAVFSGAIAAATVNGTVDAFNPVATDMGAFGPGAYTIAASGTISLAGAVGGNPNFDVSAAGIPVGVAGVTYPGYEYFNPDGSSQDNQNVSPYGPGGSTINLGALMGKIVNPNSPGAWFLVGQGTSFVLTELSSIFLLVNDTYYQNNSGAFGVSISQVPLPAAVWLFGSALFGLVAVARRRAVVA